MAAFEQVCGKALASLRHGIGQWAIQTNPAVMAQEVILRWSIEVTSKDRAKVRIFHLEDNRVAVFGLARVEFPIVRGLSKFP